MRLLVTRPVEDAAETAAALIGAGHKVLLEPLLEVRRLPVELPDLTAFQALLLTSRNGVRAFAEASDLRDLAVFAVGDATAEAARAVGFASVVSAAGDARDLAGLLRSRLDPAKGPLLHATGREGGDLLAGPLADAGFQLVRLELYETHAVSALSETARTALLSGHLDGVVFFSPRIARTFGTLVAEANISNVRERLLAVCLSSAVAEAAGGGWAGLRIARRPNQNDLLATLAGGGSEAKGIEASMVEQDGKKTEPQARAEEKTALNPAEVVIQRFGGLRPLANKLQIAVSTVQGWKARGHIPLPRHAEILAAARKHGISLPPEELAAAATERTAQDSPPDAAEETVPAGAVPSAPPSAAVPASAKSQSSEPIIKEPASKESAGKESVSREPAGRESAGRDAPASKPAATAGAATTGAASAGAAPTALPPAPEQRESDGAGLGTGLLLGAGILALGIGAAVLLRDVWLPLVDGGASRPALQDLANLKSRVTRLEERPQVPDLGQPVNELRGRFEQLTQRVEGLAESLSALAAQGGEANGQIIGQLTAQLGDLAGQLGQVSQRVADLEEGGKLGQQVAAVKEANVSLRERVADLGTQVDQLRIAQQQAGASEARAAALALALGQLREALRFHRPYSEHLSGIAALAGDTAAPAIQTLEAHAETGVSTLDDLTDSFTEAARDIVATSYGEGEDGWVAGIVRRASQVVSVRPVGEIEGDSAAALVARAESHLAEGDLAAAVAEIKALQGAAAEAAAPWLTKAEARLRVEAAMAQLTQLAIGRLAPKEG